MRGVFGEFDPLWIDDVIESWPSRARVVFGHRVEEIPTARNAFVRALVS